MLFLSKHYYKEITKQDSNKEESALANKKNGNTQTEKQI